MPNLTLSIPKEMHTKMKKHSEIRWSEVVRQSISQKLRTLEMVNKLTEKSKLTQSDVDEIASIIDNTVAGDLGLE